MRISDWSSDVCSSDLTAREASGGGAASARSPTEPTHPQQPQHPSKHPPPPPEPQQTPARSTKHPAPARFRDDLPPTLTFRQQSPIWALLTSPATEFDGPFGADSSLHTLPAPPVLLPVGSLFS